MVRSPSENKTAGLCILRTAALSALTTATLMSTQAKTESSSIKGHIKGFMHRCIRIGFNYISSTQVINPQPLL